MPNRENENHDDAIIDEQNIKPEIGIEIDGNSFNWRKAGGYSRIRF